MLATDVLRNEHRNIGRMLTIVQKSANCLDFGQKVSAQVFADAGEFLQVFACGCHAQKEEAALFEALERTAVPWDCCSLAVLRAEHARLLQFAADLRRATQRFAQDGRARRTLILSVRDNVNLLRSHIVKEDTVVFAAADAALSAAQQQGLLGQFARIEAERLPRGFHERSAALLEALERDTAQWTLPALGQPWVAGAPVRELVALPRSRVASL